MSAAEHLQEAIDVGCTRDDHDHVADHRAEVLAEADAPALDALRLIHADMVTCRSGGDEWASEWLGDLWTRLPLALRAAAGDKDAAEELADEAATGGASDG